MKKNELKSGVIYLRDDKHTKGIIVDLGQTYRAPGFWINRQHAAKVELQSGSNGFLLVIEANKDYPDELLFDAVETVIKAGLPVEGQVWPYVVDHTRKWGYADNSEYRESPKHVYPELKFKGHSYDSYGTIRVAVPRINLWLTRQILGEYAEIAKADQLLEARRHEEEKAQNAERAAQVQKSSELINRITKLGVPMHKSTVVVGGGGLNAGTITISNDLLEAILERAS